jgi:hypothetical protein
LALLVIIEPLHRLQVSTEHTHDLRPLSLLLNLILG